MTKDQIMMAEQAERDLILLEAVQDAVEHLTEVRESRTPLEFTVEGGVVTIRGTVFTERMHQQILYTIAIIPGVEKVVDMLVWDDDLRVKIGLAMAQDERLKDVTSSILVAAYQGIITLYGSVRNEEERKAAIEATRSVAGVRDVIDSLTLSGAA